MPNVLIADDSIAVRKVAERLLVEAGLGVTLVANGEEALAYLAKETPDLVVSDVIMPDCSFSRLRMVVEHRREVNCFRHMDSNGNKCVAESATQSTLNSVPI